MTVKWLESPSDALVFRYLFSAAYHSVNRILVKPLQPSPCTPCSHSHAALFLDDMTRTEVG